MKPPQPPLTVNPFGDVEPEDYVGVSLPGQGENVELNTHPLDAMTYSTEARRRAISRRAGKTTWNLP